MTLFYYLAEPGPDDVACLSQPSMVHAPSQPAIAPNPGPAQGGEPHTRDLLCTQVKLPRSKGGGGGRGKRILLLSTGPKVLCNYPPRLAKLLAYSVVKFSTTIYTISLLYCKGRASARYLLYSSRLIANV